MQELEKMLEEIDREKKRTSLSPDCSNEHAVTEIILLEKIEKIIRKHMNDGWISAKERLPERTLDEKINKSYKKYLVFIDGVDGWDIDIAVYDFWNDKNGMKLMMDMERLKMLSPGVLFQNHTTRKGA